MLRKLFLLFVCFVSTLLLGAEIAVVYAEQSIGVGERAYAKRVASHVQRWYRETGIDVDFIPDKALAATDCKLAILIYCDQPPADILAAVKQKMAKGTRFVVFYSSSTGLAKLFGLKPAAYVRNANGAWSKMVFRDAKPKGAPLEILQTSTALLRAQPLDTSVTPMAIWHNRAGQETDIAWWRTKSGSYWMTHIFTGDGNEDAKRRLLLAIAGESLPHVWKTAANFRYRTLKKWLESHAIESRMSLLPATSPRRQQMERAFETLERDRDKLEDFIHRGKGYEAYQLVSDLQMLAARVYGMSYWAISNEQCGVWDHSGQGLYPGNWERTAKELAGYGVTDVYVNVAGAAFARYPSKRVPQVTTNDCLADAIKACRKYNLRVHAWILAFSGERCNKATRDTFIQRGWLLQDHAGKPLMQTWLDPSHPHVRQHLLEIVKEMAAYDVDGIHLDFMRFAELPQSTGLAIRKRFEAIYGKQSNWPNCVTDAKGSQRENFARWRASTITDALQSICLWLRKNQPEKHLSVAAYGDYPKCVNTVGQNWRIWLRLNLVDSLLPMNYTEDENSLRDWLNTQTLEPRYAKKIICGIGVTANESRLSPIDVLNQIDISRRAKCGGFVLFDLDETLRRDVLPVLREGVTKRAP